MAEPVPHSHAPSLYSHKYPHPVLPDRPHLHAGPWSFAAGRLRDTRHATRDLGARWVLKVSDERRSNFDMLLAEVV